MIINSGQTKSGVVRRGRAVEQDRTRETGPGPTSESKPDKRLKADKKVKTARPEAVLARLSGHTTAGLLRSAPGTAKSPTSSPESMKKLKQHALSGTQTSASGTMTGVGVSASGVVEDERADDGFIRQVNHTLTDGVRSVSRGVQNGLTLGVGLQADVTGGAIEVGGKLVGRAAPEIGHSGADVLDKVAPDVLGDGVREISDRFADQVERDTEVVGGVVTGLQNGFGRSVTTTVDGLTELATNPLGGAMAVAGVVLDPVGTVKAIAEDPGALIDDYRETFNEHGWAGVAGHVLGDFALTFVTGGGGAAASKGGKLAKVAEGASHGTRAARVGRGAGRFGDELLDIARRQRDVPSAARRVAERVKGSSAGDVTRGLLGKIPGADDALGLIEKAGEELGNVNLPNGARVVQKQWDKTITWAERVFAPKEQEQED